VRDQRCGCVPHSLIGEDDADTVPVADIQAIAAPDRMVAAVVLRFQLGVFDASGNVLPSTASDLFGPVGSFRRDRDDGADIARLLREM